MAFVKVPKDLTKVKNKILFNLTKRQLICFALAGVVGIPFYLFIKNFVGTDIAAILMITLSVRWRGDGSKRVLTSTTRRKSKNIFSEQYGESYDS